MYISLSVLVCHYRQNKSALNYFSSARSHSSIPHTHHLSARCQPAGDAHALCSDPGAGVGHDGGQDKAALIVGNSEDFLFGLQQVYLDSSQHENFKLTPCARQCNACSTMQVHMLFSAPRSIASRCDPIPTPSSSYTHTSFPGWFMSAQPVRQAPLPSSRQSFSRGWLIVIRPGYGQWRRSTLSLRSCSEQAHTMRGGCRV